jgi:hypothetical protein
MGDEIVAWARARGITEILHFTTSRGVVGILADDAVHSRDHLNEENYLDNIKVLNSPSRSRDAAWTDYVNLSITEINDRMFGSSQGWHTEDDIWWAVLAFDIEILGHPGVQFTTTNNAYANAVRGPGLAGLQALFAPAVPWGTFGSVDKRHSGTRPECPTQNQAEVLYPKSVSLEYLRAIYVAEDENCDKINSWIDALADPSKVDLSAVAVLCKPEVFR